MPVFNPRQQLSGLEILKLPTVLKLETRAKLAFAFESKEPP
jgi:hypothetical protein